MCEYTIRYDTMVDRIGYSGIIYIYIYTTYVNIVL